MTNPIRVEMPIRNDSIVIKKYKTLGNLREKHKELFFVKYIFLDPKDNKLKGVNPLDECPLVPDAYLTVSGNFDDVIKLSEELVISSE